MGETAAGLRARKRQQTHDEILANAIAFFREHGIRGARMSEIAEASRVSSGTLFNYFPTKSALVEAWVRGEIEDVLTGMAEALGDRSLRPALRAACRRIAAIGEGERALRLAAWREVGRATHQAVDGSSALVRALRREQERERVRGDLPAEMLCEMLCDAVEGGVIAGLRASDSERADATGSAEAQIAGNLRRRVDLVLDGARKRNERVAAPAAAASAAPARTPGSGV